MGNHLLPLYLTLVCGASGFGKTTFVFIYLLNSGAACRFIYDDQGRDGRRLAALGIKVCYTAQELEAALATRWVVFNPSRMFPDDISGIKGFRFFCDFVYNACCRGPGKKYLVINEGWRFQDRDNIPPEFAKIALAGREEDIEIVLCTSVPQELNTALTQQCTELVCFKCGESVEGQRVDPALAKIQQLGIPADRVRALAKGQFIALNRQSGQFLSGRVF